MGSLMDSITSASARADVFKQVVMSSISDRANVSLLEQRLNPRDLEAVIKQMGILYYFDAQHPSGHYLLDLSEQTHYDLAGQLMVINAGALARDVRVPAGSLLQVQACATPGRRATVTPISASPATSCAPPPHWHSAAPHVALAGTSATAVWMETCSS